MDYRAFGDHYIIRMDPGEEILAGIREICAAEHIGLGEFRGLGAADRLELAVYDVAGKEYHSAVFEGPYEITSLFGTISEKDGGLYLHAHLSASTVDGATVGGHLNAAVISGTAEIVLVKLEGHVGRKVNPLTGLNDLEFDG